MLARPRTSRADRGLAAKVVPPGVARADWVIATELADRLGQDLGFESLDGIWAEIERVAPLYSGCTLESLAADFAADGIVVPLKGATVTLTSGPRVGSTRSQLLASSRWRSKVLLSRGGAALALGVEPSRDEDLDTTAPRTKMATPMTMKLPPCTKAPNPPRLQPSLHLGHPDAAFRRGRVSSPADQ